MLLGMEVYRERNYEALGEESNNGVGRMKLVSWEEDIGK